MAVQEGVTRFGDRVEVPLMKDLRVRIEPDGGIFVRRFFYEKGERRETYDKIEAFSESVRAQIHKQESLGAEFRENVEIIKKLNELRNKMNAIEGQRRLKREAARVRREGRAGKLSAEALELELQDIEERSERSQAVLAECQSALGWVAEKLHHDTHPLKLPVKARMRTTKKKEMGLVVQKRGGKTVRAYPVSRGAVELLSKGNWPAVLWKLQVTKAVLQMIERNRVIMQRMMPRLRLKENALRGEHRRELEASRQRIALFESALQKVSGATPVQLAKFQASLQNLLAKRNELLFAPRTLHPHLERARGHWLACMKLASQPEINRRELLRNLHEAGSAIQLHHQWLLVSKAGLLVPKR